MAHDGTLPATTIRRPDALQVFVFLQCLDALTTLLFLRMGLAEGNPLMIWALKTTYAPWIGLIFAKGVAAVLGWYCYRNQRIRLLRRANTGYSLVVGWNLIGIVAAAIAR
jgi:hypothetical protein